MIMKRMNTLGISVFLISVAYFAGAVFITTSSIGDLLPFRVVYRVIYIPLAFWIWTFAYAVLFSLLCRKKITPAHLLALGFPLHLLLLLSHSYFSVIITSSAVGSFYKFYIELILCMLQAAALYWGIDVAVTFFSGGNQRHRPYADSFFLPIVFVYGYSLSRVIAAGQSRPIVALLIAGAAAAAFYRCDTKHSRGHLLIEKLRSVTGSRRKILLLLFLCAFLIRFVFGINIIRKTQGAFPTASDDGTTYDMHGYHIAQDAAYMKSRDFAPTPWEVGYSFFLALIYKMFGRSFYVVVLLQSVMGAFVPILVFLLSELVVKKKEVALLAGAWCSLDQPLIMLSCVLGQEALYIPLVTFILFLLTAYTLDHNERAYAANGLLIGSAAGIAIVVRSALLYFIPLAAAFLLFMRNRRTLFVRIAHILLITGMTALIIAPVTYLNYANSGEFHLLTAPKPILDWESDLGGGYFFPSNKALADIGINPLKDWKGSLTAMRAQPLTFLSIGSGLLLRRSIAFFFCYNFGFFDPIYMVNAANLANRFASNFEFYLAISILLGFIALCKNKEARQAAWPMLLLLFYYIMLHVVATRMGSIRYRAPIHPFLFICGGLGMHTIARYVTKRMRTL